MVEQRTDSTKTWQRELKRLLDMARAQGRPDQYPGKRKGTRINVALPFEATLDPDSTSVPWNVHLHNISEKGFACWSRKKIKVGDRFYLRESPAEHPSQWLPAQVSHCGAGLRGFLIGARFDFSPPGTSNPNFLSLEKPSPPHPAAPSPASIAGVRRPNLPNMPK